MSIFSKIKDKIFGHKKPEAAPAPSAPAPSTSAPSHDSATITAPPPQSAAPQSVDVEAVLVEMASIKEGGGGNYRTSIVDLLKLLDLDSSLSARKELADELNVHAAEDGSAEQNIALHKAVMAQLAANGGIVPDSMRD
jgi:hypothetical protein